MRRAWQGRFGAEVATVAFLTLAAVVSTAIGAPLILFPELAALTFVVLAKPGGSWARAPVRLVLTPSLTGTLGLVVTRYLPYGLPSVLLVVGASVLVLRLTRSPIVPALSAGLLPLVFGIVDWSYPLALAAALSTLALIATVRARLSPSQPTAEDFSPPAAPKPAALAIFAVFVAAAFIVAALVGNRLVLYPPLVVTAYHMLVGTEGCPWARRPGGLVVACGLTASAGYAAFALLGHDALAVAVAASLALLVLRLLDLLVPPALAVALIPWLIADPRPTYPLAITLGTGLLTLAFLVSRPLARRLAARAHAGGAHEA